jgi:hypothetical protein
VLADGGYGADVEGKGQIFHPAPVLSENLSPRLEVTGPFTAPSPTTLLCAQIFRTNAYARRHAIQLIQTAYVSAQQGFVNIPIL